MKDPKDDLTTALVTAEVDGESLTPAELASFFVLLVVAGNETTRNAISHGLARAHGPPRAAGRMAGRLRRRWPPTAVEEIVRWATPVIHFRRTVHPGRRAHRRPRAHGRRQGRALLRVGQPRRAPSSTTRSASTSRRTPNDHLGFGGPGPHFCLGAHLARREITVMFRELFRRMPDLRAAGEPVRLQSNFINGIKHLPATWTPAPAG